MQRAAREAVGLGYIPNCFAHPDVGITLAWFKLEIADAEMQNSAHFILLHRICQDQTPVRVSLHRFLAMEQSPQMPPSGEDLEGNAGMHPPPLQE